MKLLAKLLAVCVVLSLPMIAVAEGPTKGEKEIALRASYSDIDFGSAEGFDLGGTKDTEIDLLYGWMLTDMHEVGLLLSYVKQEFEGGSFFMDESTDGTAVGGFYHLNFTTSGNMTPFVGVNISALGGDVGDVYDLQYGIEAGLKVYPFEHGGIGISLEYATLQADTSGVPDADGIGLGAALILKY